VRILELVAFGDPAERLAGGERLTVAGIDVADLSLRHGDKRYLVDAILPAPEAPVYAAAQEIGLQTGLAAERDDPALRDGAPGRPQLFDDADAIVGNVTHPEQLADQQHAEDDTQDTDPNPARERHLGFRDQDRQCTHVNLQWARAFTL